MKSGLIDYKLFSISLIDINISPFTLSFSVNSFVLINLKFKFLTFAIVSSTVFGWFSGIISKTFVFSLQKIKFVNAAPCAPITILAF